MKHIDFIYGGTIGTLLLLAIVVFIIIIRSKKNKGYDQNQEDRRLLDWRNIPEEDIRFLSEEQPFVDCYKSDH